MTDQGNHDGNQKTLPIFLTLQEAAKILRCSPSKLRKLKGGPPRRRPPGMRKYLYPSKGLLRWVETGAQIEPKVEREKENGKDRRIDSPRPHYYHRNALYRIEPSNEDLHV